MLLLSFTCASSKGEKSLQDHIFITHTHSRGGSLGIHSLESFVFNKTPKVHGWITTWSLTCLLQRFWIYDELICNKITFDQHLMHLTALKMMRFHINQALNACKILNIRAPSIKATCTILEIKPKGLRLTILLFIPLSQRKNLKRDQIWNKNPSNF